MSSISKMQIRGIRSFSPDRDETIEFYSPLTMIVGANGCGKTTIIESLKFACTGSMPPNTKSGQSFVNDPMMTDSTGVKAHIKLRFQNSSDMTCVAVRSLQVLKKRTKLEFKALEGVLRTTDKNGEKVSISMKCSDIDRIIPENLGISPAIIENVIFVHQEDCNWPMQEGLVLKKRFDDVFESTRYTKALEALNKTKKEIVSKAKDLKAELMEQGAHLQATVLTKNELENYQENQENTTSELDRLKTELEGNQDRLKQCTEALEAVRSFSTQIDNLERQVQETERRVMERQQGLDHVLDGTDAEIQRDLADFDNLMQQRSQELQTLQRSKSKLDEEIRQIRQSTQQLQEQRGQGQMLLGESNKFRQRQTESAATLQRKYGLPALPPIVAGGVWAPTVVRGFLQNLKNELQKIQAECAANVNAGKKNVDTHERACRAVESQIQGLNTELRLKDQEAQDVLQETNGTRQELGRLSSSRSAIQQCQVEFENAQRTHDEFMESFPNKSAQYKKQIKDASDQIRDLQETISADATLLQDLSMHRNEIAALDGSIKQLKIDSDQVTADISTIFRCHQDLLSGHAEPHDQPTLDTFLGTLTARNNELQLEHRRHAEEHLGLKSGLAGEEAVISQLTARKQTLLRRAEDLQGKHTALLDLAGQLNELIGNPVLARSDLQLVSNQATIDELFEATKKTEEEAKELLVLTRANKIFNKRFAKYRQNNGGACPCCGQGMSTAVEKTYERNVKELFALSDEDNAQASLEEHKFVAAKCSSLYAAVKDLHTAMQPLNEINTEIAGIETDIAEHTQSTADIRKKLMTADAQEKDSDRTCKAMSTLIRELHEANLRWQNLTKRSAEVAEKKRRQSQSLMSVDLGSRSYDDLEQAQRSNNELKDELQAKKDRLTVELNNLTNRLGNLRLLLSESEKALSEAKVDGARHGELEGAVTKLQARTQEIDQRKAVLHRELEQLAREMKEKKLVLNDMRNALAQAEDLSHGKLSMIRRDVEEFEKISESLEDIDKRLAQADLPTVDRQMEEKNRAIQAKEEEVKGLVGVITISTTDLASQEHTRKNMQGNLALRRLIVDLDVQRAQLRELVQEHGGEDFANRLRDAERDMQRCQRSQQTLSNARDVLKGKLEVYSNQVADLKAKLNTPLYRGIEERHRRKNIEYETTNLAIADLDSYYNALDKALQNFHTLKIREINKIIRELWQLIYKGQDIDSIEIESGQEEGAAATKTTRSYNYRVVMRKGDIPLDMRGRCSAGQKVLAAIVIRLALAETFCLNCGMLALDEPTTNLDEANKAGLAHALARIIKSRSAQHNFQLICITHDEDFVRLMGNELSSSADFNLPEHYFRVYRQEEGNTGKFFSHIERVPWEDM